MTWYAALPSPSKGFPKATRQIVNLAKCQHVRLQQVEEHLYQVIAENEEYQYTLGEGSITEMGALYEDVLEILVR